MSNVVFELQRLYETSQVDMREENTKTFLVSYTRINIRKSGRVVNYKEVSDNKYD